MNETARLSLVVDSSSLAQGESAMDSLARTGGKVEDTLKVSAKGIEQAMARISGVMGGLDATMKSLERAVSQSMGRSAQEVSKGARTFDDLRRQIDPAYAASQRFAVVQGDLARMVIDGSASQQAANAVLEIARSRYLGVATAAEAAEQAQREQAAAVAQATGNYEALRNALDPVYASSKRYEAAVETANTALRAKIITEAEHARVLQLAQTRYLGLTPAVAGTSAGLARFTPQITNASFQLQDFAVQVASGQSALTAFTQQFPQLAGALGVSGKLALLGAGLGTVVAIGAAVLPLFLSMGNSAKAAEDAVSDLNSAFSAYKSAIDGTNLSVEDLTTKFGANAEAARALYLVMRDLAELEMAQAMSAAIAAATGQFEGLGAELERINALSRASIGDFGGMSAASGRLAVAIGNLADKYGLGYGQAVELNKAMKALEEAKGPQEQARAAAALVQELREAQRSGAAIPPEIMATAQQLAQASMLGLQLGGNLDNAAAAASNAAAAARNLAAALSAAAGFSLGIDNQIEVIGARIAAQKAGADAAIAGTIKQMQIEAAASRDRQIAAGVDQYNAEALYQLDLDRIAQLGEMTAEEKALAKATGEVAKGRKAAASEAEKASKQAAKEAEKLSDNLDKEAQKWREVLDPMAKYRREAAELAKLTGRLSQDEMAEAQRRLNIQLADSLPLAGKFTDIMTDGLLSGFKGTLSDIGDMLKSWLAQMIAMAAKNRIMISMGLGGLAGGGGALSSALGAAGAPVGGLTGVGGVLGGIASLGTAAMSAFTGGLQAAMGGIGSITQYTSLMMGGATTSLAGLASAAGAIAVPLLAVAAVFSFFRKKTKELDAGLRITVDGLNTAVDTFRKTETRRFWGLSKKTRTSYDRADQETQDALSSIVGNIQTGVMDAAAALGFGAETFAGFAHQMTISTKGMSKEDAQRAVEQALAGLGDGFAGMIPGLNALRKDGESTTEALNRLSTSLTGVNAIMDTLGHRFHAVGLAGADAASKIAEAFGGLDAMVSATQQYYQAFYTDAERLAVTTRQTSAALAELGIAMPQTRQEYRRMIASLDLTTEAGREAYAALIGLSGAFDLILPQISGFTREMTALQDRVVASIGTVIGGLSEAIRLNTSAAADWRKAGDGIRDYLDRLRGTASALFSPQQARAYNQALYQRTLRQANSGDVEAAGRLPGVADSYLSSVNDMARSRTESALAQARVAVALSKVAVRTDTTATALERVAALQQRQVDILTGVQNHLAAGNTLTQAGITRLLGQLGSLDDRIALRAGDARTIVAGVSDALGNANVTASLTGADGLRASMGTLRTSLVDLRQAIAAETARSERQRKVAALNTYVGGLTANAAGNHFVDDADLTAMSRAAGINTAGLNTSQIRNRLAAFDGGDLLRGTVYDPTGNLERNYLEKERLKQEVSGIYGTIRQMMTQYGVTTANPFVLNDKGVRSNPHTGHFFINGRHITDHNHPFWNTLWGSGGLWARFTSAETALRNTPGFATGGTHLGGLRIVGENGPELEATGPSRIFSHRQSRAMLDNSEMVRELRAVRAELAEMKAHARGTAESTRDTFKTLREINSVGVKIDPDQNKVAT